MARRVRDATLDSREARRLLKPRGKPYWRALEKGLHVGYRRLRGKPGTWIARHYVGHGRYQTEAIGPTDDLSDADGVVILDFWQAQVKARGHMVQRAHAANGTVRTVKEAVEIYLKALEAEGRSTRDARWRAEALVYPTLGDFEIASLTAKGLKAWLTGLAGVRPRLRTPRGQSQRYREIGNDEDAARARRATANRTWAIVRAALNHCRKEADIACAPVWRDVEPFKKVAVARARYLTVAEAKRLINASDAGFRPLVEAALQTGARYGELARLEVQDFNPDAGTLHIRKSKSGRSRHVTLTDEGVAFFAALAAGRGGGELLIRRANGGAWGRARQGQPMREAVRRARISPSISFHGLRHTWASLAVMGGVPLMVVAKNLGHTDTSMVERHYGHLAPSFVRDAIRDHAPRFGIKVDRKVTALRR
jgi:integrase